jgi:hypothetical protein
MNPVSGGPHQVWGMGENESFNLALSRATMGFVWNLGFVHVTQT